MLETGVDFNLVLKVFACSIHTDSPALHLQSSSLIWGLCRCMSYLARCCCSLQGAAAAACPCDLMRESPMEERGCHEGVLCEAATQTHEQGGWIRFNNLLIWSNSSLRPNNESQRNNHWWQVTVKGQVDAGVDHNHQRRKRKWLFYVSQNYTWI